jgi:hypothetical protein
LATLAIMHDFLLVPNPTRGPRHQKRKSGNKVECASPPAPKGSPGRAAHPTLAC